ncbi:MAG: hypothetical protein N2039_06160 [Gemmataceae bacterium]|nr:hypothetical protein [Gemmataceae bacterium]
MASLTLGLAVTNAADDERKPPPAPALGEAMRPERSEWRGDKGDSDEATRNELRQLRAELEELKRSRQAPAASPPTATPQPTIAPMAKPSTTPPTEHSAPSAKPDPPGDTADLVAERARLKARLFDLLERIPSRRAPATSTPAVEPPPEWTSESFRPVDRIRYVQNLIKAGQYATALRASKVMDPANFSGKQGAMLRYLQASAHRRAGDLEAAKKLYAELAQSRDDDFLAECAAWQLQAIRTREELTGRLDITRAARPER